ncbi:PKD domain-containing protein [Algoriphagus halophytocola]|uniref:PKD domain-containing protein n=1 Tax=Algoriphagus halophytocola TaxID=2991499 RepID=A0ABY6MJE1_9BACT|nr:PKD domain-containing protein [Algoriphagus sp. TR-M5]UZD22537.1 PKD domain-containing protein [Algoriphagus sp. TR-M5]
MLRILRLTLFLCLLTGSFIAKGQIGFPYCESFADGETQAATILGGSAKMVDGALRLTEAVMEQSGYVYIDVPFSSAYGIKASFEYFMYGGSGADGLTVFLFDAETQNFQPGGFGGSLGYAQRNNTPGLTGAYLGLGFDAFGNFGNTNENRNGGFLAGSTSLFPNSIVLRRGGSGLTGYEFVNGKITNDPPPGTAQIALDVEYQFPLSSGGFGTTRVEDLNQPGYRKVFLELEPHPNGVGYLVKLEMVVTTVQNEPRTITIFQSTAFTLQAPKNLKIGFAASTGGETNIHEIKNLLLEVSNEEDLQNPQGVDFSDFASCEGQENQYYITDEEVVLPNENSEIRCLQFYASLEEIEEESEDICAQGKCREDTRELVLPEGTFRAGDDGGDFTFFPNEGFTDQEVTVYYTITDNYGKSSTGNSMTLKIQESPEPVTLFVEDASNPETEIRLCGGESVSLQSEGNEAYDRYEWYKDGELIEGEASPQLIAGEKGVYQVYAYNRKNCPAKSNEITLVFPEFPGFEVEDRVVGCTPGEPVDVSAVIAGFDLTLYDYRLVNTAGEQFINEELRSIAEAGDYELSLKHKDLECWSSPNPLEVIILDEEFVADFEFEVLGTGVKGEEDGGFFPDDQFQFTDRSDETAVSWFWDFGDGSTSEEKNPTHIYGKKGSFNVSLTITNELGCESVAEKTLEIIRSYRLMFPTGFTPLDNTNELFEPKYKGLVSGELLIFNLWGELIFRSESLDELGWDGKLDGELLDAGIYIYRFNGVATDGEEAVDSGKFKLIR